MTESEEIERLKAEIKALRDIIDEKPGKMVGNSGEMRAVYKQIKACAGNDAPALICDGNHHPIAKAVVNAAPSL